MRQIYSDDTLDLMPIEDPYVATCINEDGMIQIAEKLYKINIDQNLIYVLNEINDDNVALLMNEDIVPDLIDTFDLRIPVLIPDPELKQIPASLKMLGCSENGAKKKKRNDGDGTIPDYDYSDYDLDIKLVYQPVGVYFSILAEVEHRLKGGNKKSAPTYLGMQNVDWWVYKPICKTQASTIGSNGAANSYHVKMRIYEKIRSLYTFDITVRFTWEQKDNPGNYSNADLTISN